MNNWRAKVTLKHIINDEKYGDDHESVQQCMNAVADILEREHAFATFRHNIAAFRNIPKGDEYFGPEEYADKLLAKMYDYADRNRIWID